LIDPRRVNRPERGVYNQTPQLWLTISNLLLRSV
jgi:hypothetical protein